MLYKTRSASLVKESQGDCQDFFTSIQRDAQICLSPAYSLNAALTRMAPQIEAVCAGSGQNLTEVLVTQGKIL